jgi:uncharacterized peroxidase-related enzyme
VLLQIYQDRSLIEQIVENPQAADIPDMHKQVFSFAERFTRHSWTTVEHDIDGLRRAGLADAEIALWATRACGQTWFTMSADGGGVPLDGEAAAGPAVGRERASYQATPELVVQNPTAKPAIERDKNDICWIDVNEHGQHFNEVATRTRQRYGFVPNLITALSLRDETLNNIELALKLLDEPQSGHLDARRHAMVRARVANLNQCDYSIGTTRSLLEQTGAEPDLYARIIKQQPEVDDDADRAVLDFASKIARNAYKVTERDAQEFRAVGLDDEAYLDVLNAAALQTSLDRLANSLGVAPDANALVITPLRHSA